MSLFLEIANSYFKHLSKYPIPVQWRQTNPQSQAFLNRPILKSGLYFKLTVPF